MTPHLNKECYRCKTAKPHSEYNKNRARADGLSAYCRECQRETLRLERIAHPERARQRAKSWRSRNPIKAKRQAWASMLKSQYGLTIKEYCGLFIDQGGRCIICRRAGEKLHVDHNHLTGAIRGLLCGRCNRGIGMFSDDPARIREAASYVEARA